MTDAALVLRAKQGDELAIRRLLNRYDRLIRSIAASYFILGGEADDVLQEARFGFFKAVRDFRPDRDSGFANFMTICVRRQVITAVKAAARDKHAPLNGSISLRSAVVGDNGMEDRLLEEVLADERRPDPATAIESLEETETVRRAFGRLSVAERQAITGLASGFTYEEVARSEECDVKAVDNAAQRARGKLRQALEAAA